MRRPGNFLFFFTVLILFSTISAYAGRCPDGRVVDMGCQCDHTCNASSRGNQNSSGQSSSSGNNNAAIKQSSSSKRDQDNKTYESVNILLQNTINILEQERLWQAQEQERLKNEALERELREQEQNHRAQEQNHRAQERLRSVANDPNLNPWLDKKQDQTLSAPKIANGQTKPPSKAASSLEPDKNYDGQPCHYFTRPSDEAHLNYHRDGQMVKYGDNIYECKDGRWRFRVNSDSFWGTKQALDSMDASRLESSPLNNVKVHDDE